MSDAVSDEKVLSVPFALPDITEEEIDAVVGVLRSRWLTTGAHARAFEEEFAAAVDAPHALAVNSCTAALHLSLEAMSVGPGDTVLVPPYTFAASAEVVRYLGAVPVFVDVEPETANLDAGLLSDALERAVRIGPPKAIMPVHFAGVACEMDAVWEFARGHDLAVVEDAAHAFPSAYFGRPVGWIPQGVRGTTNYSFYATKTITTAEGGMVTSHDPALDERMRVMSLHGLSRQAWNRYSGGTWKYDIVAPGFKYNMTDVAAAMGRVQLRRATAMSKRRAEIAQRYTEAFAPLGVFDCPGVPEGRETSWHLYSLRLSAPRGEAQRDRLIDALKARGISPSMHFIPLHLHSYYRDTYGVLPEDYPIALDIYRRSLSLPIYSSMTEEEIDAVISAVVREGAAL